MNEYRRAIISAIAFHYVWSAGNGYDTLDAEQDAWEDTVASCRGMSLAEMKETVRDLFARH